MMRKIALPLTLLGAAMLAPPLQAADGSINVTGRVTESSCVLDASSKNQTVIWGKTEAVVPKMVLAYSRSIYVQLADCPDSIDQVKVRFEGTQANTQQLSGNVFAIDNSDQPDAAENVGFIISNAQGKNGGFWNDLLRVNEFSPAIELNKREVNKLEFRTGYSTDNKMPTAGVARTRIQFSLIYP
ncbi:fimbrial protein [Serratia bockelmannii]|nr:MULTISPECIES: fimbrial protein [Serratia]MDN6880639.1 fimbrial protein [Serratia bockelmannii]HBH6886493.1 fimbrial protein [Serratia marcescens]